MEVQDEHLDGLRKLLRKTKHRIMLFGFVQQLVEIMRELLLKFLRLNSVFQLPSAPIHIPNPEFNEATNGVFELEFDSLAIEGQERK